MENNRNMKGFTLIEILFALFVGLILMGAVLMAMNAGQRTSSAMERKVAAQQDVRAALEIITLEIGMASYNPNFATDIWRAGPQPPDFNDCTAIGIQANKGIQEATPNSITVQMDIGENGAIGDPDTNEIIRYSYDTANQYITRLTQCGTAQPFLGAINQPTAVRVINNTLNGGAGIPVFRYFDGKNPANELHPNVTPTDLPNIRRIDITLAVETEEVAADTRQRRQMVYSSSVIPRNHAYVQ